LTTETRQRDAGWVSALVGLGTSLQSNLEKTYFAWDGPITAGNAAYFRVSGPSILIKFLPQSMGEASNHTHSMLRDPTNNYGAALLK
jgi:Protein of unknown function (DUF3500)